MKGLILKDLLNLKSTFKMLGVMMLFFAVVFIPQGNGFIFGMIILMFAMMVVTTISYDDLAKWDAYALTMPVTRKEMVLSKYLVMAILNTLGAVLSLIVGIVGSVIMRQSFDLEILAIIGSIYLVAFIFGSVIIPLIYKFGTEKARLMLFLCALLPTALILLVEQFNVPLPIIGNPWIYLFLLIGFSVAGVILSYLISLKIYSQKEF
ncbi:ABC-2 transporter permease [Acetobacterium malicum]|uniref:ABC-2 transporter permease n=1 Tax=Acetobacterium malicum TaxID=52692 RepID=A0ABR6YWV3_9FIRM|nr:ABC-2 transporter permease [Acetobacterium malicum]MBC3899623.1 ABC-2 transporter permease [Acetobacterium malicum]